MVGITSSAAKGQSCALTPSVILFGGGNVVVINLLAGILRRVGISPATVFLCRGGSCAAMGAHPYENRINNQTMIL